jgi:NTP pyrophosphatase (non-canonical NTP hydrolase)
LEEELGDMIAMICILEKMGVVNQDALELATKAKIEKLKKWSNIQNLESI